MTASAESANGKRALARMMLMLPYILVLLLYLSVSRLLALPGILIVVAVVLLYERLHAGSLWRYPAGWLVSLLLIVPCSYLYVYERIALIPVVLAPVALLVIAHYATSGRLGRWWSAQPMFGSLLYLVVTAALLFGATGRFGLPPLTDDLLFELYVAPEGFRLNQVEMEAAIELVEASILEYQRNDGDGIPSAVHEEALDLTLRQERHREVFVTLWVDRRSPIRGRSHGNRLFEDLCRATDQALDSTTRWETWVRGADHVRIQVDISHRPVRLHRRAVHQSVLRVAEAMQRVFAPRYYAKLREKDDRPFGKRGFVHQLFYEVEPGVDGLVLRAGDKEGVILPGDVVTRGWLTPRVLKRTVKIDTMLRQLCRDARGSRDLWSLPGTDLYKFRSFCFGRPVPDGSVVELYRGNVLIDDVDSQAILDGLEEAGLWLLRTVKPDGSFDYEYFPNTNAGSKGYNIVRHAGCVYGLFHMYNLALTEPQLKDDADDFLEAGIRAMGWVYDNLGAPRKAEGGDLVALIDERKRASSGAAALTLLSFLERPAVDQLSHPVLREHLGRPEDEAIIEGLGSFLLAMVGDDGRVFKNHRDRYRICKGKDGEPLEEISEFPREYCKGEKEPLYYPGETMLALIRLYEVTGEDRWLDGARRIGDWQVARYNSLRPNPDHWVMQALWHLYQVTGDESYATAGMRMGDRYASEQFPPHWPPFRDYFGAYRRHNDVPRTTRACSRSEAMGGVVHIAWANGSNAKPYEDALIRAAEHLLENQWRPLNSYFLPNPDKARGAIRMGLVDNHCRIDNNQHAVVGLHRALEVARKREGVPMPTVEVLPPLPSDEEIAACRGRFAGPVEDEDGRGTAAGAAKAKRR